MNGKFGIISNPSSLNSSLVPIMRIIENLLTWNLFGFDRLSFYLVPEKSFDFLFFIKNKLPKDIINMKYPFSSIKKRFGNSGFDDQFNNIQDLMDFDAYSGWEYGVPSATDNTFASYVIPSTQSIQPDGDNDNIAVYSDGVGLCNKQNHDFISSCTISRPLIGHSLFEKMHRALSLFKQSSGGGILAQVWVPIKQGNQYILSTYEQPYLHDHMLERYREISRGFTFSAEMKPGSFHGLPGRVFVSKVPEWTSNVSYYDKSEYLRLKHAVDHEVRGSIAIPVFDSSEKSCCAVLELVTVKEKPDFDSEMEDVCRAFQAVNMKTTIPHPQSQSHSKNKKAALAEVKDVLKAICHAHRLPLALTWIPCTKIEGEETLQVKNYNNKCTNDTTVLCVEEKACYTTDTKMLGFVRACAEHYLEEGQGNAGNALQSNKPCFSPDIKEYNISSYPLVHHARKFSLNAAVAIRLRSIYTGDDDYILEFFLPVNMKGCVEQQLVLNNLPGIMQKMSRSLRTVSDSELLPFSGSKLEILTEVIPSMSTIAMHLNEADDHWKEGIINGLERQQENMRSTTDKTVSLSVLQKYFSGSLKDGARGIGVCPTTLKKICRQHGISRWPSRKINKANRSLKKIQTMVDSVQGGILFDPTIGKYYDSKNSFSAKKSISKVHDTILIPPSSLTVDPNKFPMTLEDCEFFLDLDQNKWDSSNCNFWSQNSDHEMDIKMDGCDKGIVEHNLYNSSSTTESSNGSDSTINSNGSISPDDSQTTNIKTGVVESEPKIIVKASYKEDTIRFKFGRLTGFHQLNEEIAKRFELQTGTFQLKYLDDEKEWVMVVNDSDLQECLEELDSLGAQRVMFLVRDLPCGFGSSSLLAD